MSTSPILRNTMTPIARRWRAYFAPVQRESSVPVVFDPACDGAFDLDSPPAPWIDAGWIDRFQRSSATRISSSRAGESGTIASQFRSHPEASVEFDFLQWGKLQMAISSGCEHLNVLAAASGSRKPSGANAIGAVELQSGSTATQLVFATSAAFAAGDIVAVDLDYSGQTGYVGTGISAAYLNSPAGLDADYLRRVTFNVARVSSVSGNALQLSQPILGGAPSASAKVQKVIAFADREGGRFFQEWSGLFVSENDSGGRICFYYPRMQAKAPASEGTVEVTDPVHAIALHASLTALPYPDPADGTAAVCWRSYFPPVTAPVL